MSSPSQYLFWILRCERQLLPLIKKKKKKLVSLAWCICSELAEGKNTIVPSYAQIEFISNHFLIIVTFGYFEMPFKTSQTSFNFIVHMFGRREMSAWQATLYTRIYIQKHHNKQWSDLLWAIDAHVCPESPLISCGWPFFSRRLPIIYPCLRLFA